MKLKLKRKKYQIYLLNNGDIEIYKVYDFIIIEFSKKIKTVKTISELMSYLVKTEYDGIEKAYKSVQHNGNISNLKER